MTQHRLTFRAALGAALLASLAACGEKAAPAGDKAPETATQALTSGPDFVVTSVTGPQSVRLDQPLALQVRVCNQGTVGAGTLVEGYVSTDAVITPPVPPNPPSEVLIGSESVWLSPGECQTRTLVNSSTFPNQSSAGVYYVGAMVDPGNAQAETDEGNNTRVGAQIAVGNGPDFVVSALTGATAVQPNQTFTAEARVCNQGTYGSSTRVALLLSSDAVITAPVPPNPPTDTLLTDISTGYLEPGKCQNVSLMGSANVPTNGTYYLGAVANFGYSPDLNPGNDTSAARRLAVGYGPDFVVASVTGPTSTPNSGGFQAQVRVCNQGTTSGSPLVELYLSTDATISPAVPPNPPADFFAGSASAPPSIEPGQCRTVPVWASANVPTDGAYYLGAAVYPAPNELLTDNNTTVGPRITVGYAPDFVITSVTGPSSTQSYGGIQAQVRVCNQGTTSGSPFVELYLSTDATISPAVPPNPPADFFVGSAPGGPSLEAGQCRTVPVWGSVNVPTDGAYYLGAAVNGGSIEFLTDNNVASGSIISVGNRPDFAVTAVTGPASAMSGDSITVAVTVCNQGTVSGSTNALVVLSQDAVVDVPGPYTPFADPVVGNAWFHSLEPGECATVTVLGSVPYTYSNAPQYLAATVEAQGASMDVVQANNTLVGQPLGVGTGADLVVTSVTGPASATPGQSFTATLKVCNQGTAPGAGHVELYLSEDAVITRTPQYPYSYPPVDALVGSSPVNTLNPGTCRTLSVQGNANTPFYDLRVAYLGAAVSDGSPPGASNELRSDNNIRVGERMGIGYAHDFVITSLKGPASATPGQTANTLVKVCNQGTQSASGTVELFLSEDTVITRPQPYSSPVDTPVGAMPTGDLAPGVCASLSVPGTFYAPYGFEGTVMYLGAAVSDGSPPGSTNELRADNNTYTSESGRIVIGSKPDFALPTYFNLLTSGFLPGATLSFPLKVCNYGTVSGSTVVELYLSKDEVISRPGPGVPSTDVLVGSTPVGPLNPGQCTITTVTGPAYAPYGVEAPFVGAIVNGGAPPDSELRTDNNARSYGRVGVGNRPDFTVFSMSGPASITAGQSISSSVMVCNYGTEAGSTSVGLYLSPDATIAPMYEPSWAQDFRVAEVNTAYLAPNQCQSLTLAGPSGSPQPQTEYSLGAVVNRSGDMELRTDNNRLVRAITIN
ncbi:CARDB domain-containing protein [Myxococcaceae bacterium GXIMD 01537]